MTISQLANTANVRSETIRYYQRLGLLRTPQRRQHGFRAYDDTDVAHLQFIKHGQTLGFTLDEIAMLLRLSSSDCADAERLAKSRLAIVRSKIRELRRLESALKHTVFACEHNDTNAECPLLEALLGPAAAG